MHTADKRREGGREGGRVCDYLTSGNSREEGEGGREGRIIISPLAIVMEEEEKDIYNGEYISPLS